MIVYVSGVFDLFHYGHMILLKKIKKKFKGCELIVGVHSDEDCESYKRVPILTMKERIKYIEEFGIANKIIDKAPLIETLEFYNKYSIEKVIHAHPIEEHYKYYKMYKEAIDNNMFERIDYTSSISTTDIINRIKKM